jgi:hypothetical protein
MQVIAACAAFQLFRDGLPVVGQHQPELIRGDVGAEFDAGSLGCAVAGTIKADHLHNGNDTTSLKEFKGMVKP